MLYLGGSWRLGFSGFSVLLTFEITAACDECPARCRYALTLRFAREATRVRVMQQACPHPALRATR